MRSPPRCGLFRPARQVNEQPWCVLHELAHAYHDQVLGFDDPRILQAYDRYKKSGHGDSVLLITGQHVRHYALTNHKEFFAEMSEAYFGFNDSFPFNRETQDQRTRNLRPDADRLGSDRARPMTSGSLLQMEPST